MSDAASTVAVVGTKIPPKVPADAWKWPPVWPFPTDALDVVDSSLMPNQPEVKFAESYSSDQGLKFKEHILANVPNKQSKILELSSKIDGIVTSDSSLGFTDIQHITLKSIDKTAGPESLLQVHTPHLSVPSNSLDVVLVSSGIDLLTNPRDVFREIWRVLKPGGKCQVCFSDKSIADESFKPVKMWTTMTDEQKIWIVGSYFQYSAGVGWNKIEGYDLFSINSELLVFDEKIDETKDSAYVVQANKLTRDFDSPSFTIYDKISYSLLPSKNLEPDDKEYISLRLAADYEKCESNEQKKEILENVSKLSEIYDTLKDVKDTVIPKPIKSILANYLFSSWTNSRQQIDALRMGLGVQPPDDYWRSIGELTKNMLPRNKIIFLAEIIPLFGTNDKLLELPNAISSIVSRLEEKLSDETERKYLETFAAKIVVTDFLNETTDDPLERILRYIDTMTKANLSSIITVEEDSDKKEKK